MTEQLMTGRTVLVTGGTSGIGRATAAGLASMGAQVVITGRDQSRADAVAVDLRIATGNTLVAALAADLSSQREVRALAARVLELCPRLHVLVNNVGGFWAHRHETADGLERTFALNHLAPFLLTNLLRDRLVESAPARVVTVSSGAHSMGRIAFDDLQSVRRYSAQRAYNASKLANVLFSYELARRLAGTGVTANALHPGVVATRFGIEDPAPWGPLLPFARRLLKSPERGAETSIFLASSPEVAGVTGRYFVNCRVKKSSAASYDEVLAARLWRVSAELVGLSAP
ncbi:SDR family oxidoreductase [Microlunatus panaciterrae]|uniref:NAD(P)-dependent dehydrogenase (Short-subunit alcohol dehydrogenase family) n=1 Tax=Microlunatus panaciterrae TaxID=400768 RepID=A0ABS2RJQ1_9ACTN|nr:SDR family oxidoreductase [Microlunatus panaciterrae]MBM7798888.1 NAD(P)-dependent dehydrogenase (short-subunit alcohol dehydrogenase family) [Microlunatus panaciterrae]